MYTPRHGLLGLASVLVNTQGSLAQAVPLLCSPFLVLVGIVVFQGTEIGNL